MKLILIMLLLMIPIVNATSLDVGTKLNDGNYDYTVNYQIQDAELSTVNITDGELYLNGVSFCNYGRQDRFTTLRPCPQGVADVSEGGGQGPLPVGNINETCIRMGGHLVMDEFGKPLCILDNETFDVVTSSQDTTIEKQTPSPYGRLIQLSALMGVGMYIFLYYNKQGDKDESISEE